jgi:hypothetical protein
MSFGAGFNSTQTMERFGAILFDIPDVGYRVSQVLYFCFDICSIDGVVRVLKHYSVGAIFFRFVCMEFCTFLGQGFDNCPIRVRLLLVEL